MSGDGLKKHPEEWERGNKFEGKGGGKKKKERKTEGSPTTSFKKISKGRICDIHQNFRANLHSTHQAGPQKVPKAKEKRIGEKETPYPGWGRHPIKMGKDAGSRWKMGKNKKVFGEEETQWGGGRPNTQGVLKKKKQRSTRKGQPN